MAEAAGSRPMTFSASALPPGVSGRGSARHPPGPASAKSATMATVPGTSPKHGPIKRSAAKNSNSDIGRLVESYRKIHSLSWPLVFCYECGSVVLSWEYPSLSIAVWLCFQLFCYYITAGQFAFVAFLLLSATASLGYLSLTNQLLNQSTSLSSNKKQQILSLLSQKPAKASQTLRSSSSSSTLLPSPSSSAYSSASSSAPLAISTQVSANSSQTVASADKNAVQAKLPKTSSSPQLSSSPPTISPPPPHKNSCHDNHHALTEAETLRKKELLAEYKLVIRDLAGWLKVISGVLRWLEDSLLWKHKRRTLLIYTLIYAGVLSLVCLPFRWVTIVTSNCAFVANPNCSAFVQSWVKTQLLHQKTKKKEEEGRSDLAGSAEQKGLSESRLQKDGLVSSHPLAEDMMGSEDSNDPSKDGETNSVSFTAQRTNSEERPLKPANAPPKKFESGMCYLCGSYFTSVLKRRRYCRYCGRDFCPKCCSKKLPRSALGATAPAAQTEKELVCNLCIIKLTGDESVLSR